MSGNDEPQELTIDLVNVALGVESRKLGYCLCIHPMMHMIDMFGCSCQWCEQPVPKNATFPEFKAIRTSVVLTAYPWARK